MNTTTDRIEKKITLSAPLARVWRALTDAEEFGTWFGMKLEGAFTEGARVRGHITPTKVDPEVAAKQKEHEGLPFELSVETLDPPRVFAFRWHPHAVERGKDYVGEPTTLVSFTLEEVPGGVLLTLVESGFDSIPVERRAKAFSENEQGWTLVLTLIGKHLARTS